MKHKNRSHIVGYRDIKLSNLIIGKGPVRTRDVGEGIEELAHSIRTIGLLQPILVCPAGKRGKYYIIAGQRRFLAYRLLRKKKIIAGVLAGRIDDTMAKVYSLTENLVRWPGQSRADSPA